MKPKKILLFFLGSILLISNYSFQINGMESEYNLKAAFLYRFLDYIEWDSNHGEPLNIAVLGKSGIYQPLLEISRDQTGGNKVINVRAVSRVNEVGNIQVIFISRSYKYPVETAISRLDPKQVLIISEQKGALDKGSHINFILSDNKLKFEINLKKASGSGFKIGSDLLKHAFIIKR